MKKPKIFSFLGLFIFTLIATGFDAEASIPFLKVPSNAKEKNISNFVGSDAKNYKIHASSLFSPLDLEMDVLIPVEQTFTASGAENFVVSPRVLPLGMESYLDQSLDTVEFYFGERVIYEDEESNRFAYKFGHSATRIGDVVYNLFPDLAMNENFYNHRISVLDFFLGEKSYLFYRNNWSIKFRLPQNIVNELKVKMDQKFGVSGDKIENYDALSNNCVNPVNNVFEFLGIRPTKGLRKFVYPFDTLYALHHSDRWKRAVEKMGGKVLGTFFYPQVHQVDGVLPSEYGRGKNFFELDKMDKEVTRMPDLGEVFKQLQEKMESITDKVLAESLDRESTDPNYMFTYELLSCDGVRIVDGAKNISFMADYLNAESHEVDRKYFTYLRREILHKGALSKKSLLDLANRLGLSLDKLSPNLPYLRDRSDKTLLKIANNSRWPLMQSLVRRPDPKKLDRIRLLCAKQSYQASLGDICSKLDQPKLGLEKLQTFLDLVLNHGLKNCE